jgi:hypothetical protein
MNDEATSQSRGPTGLGGWLILVCIGLFVGPFRVLALLVETYLPIFQDGTWEFVTTPGTDAYHPLFGPLLLFEVLWNVALVGAAVTLLFLFFKRSQKFPKFYIVVAVAQLLFLIIDTWLASSLLVDEPVLDPETIQAFSQQLVTVLVWVPYMRVSKRVKNTFLV